MPYRTNVLALNKKPRWGKRKAIVPYPARCFPSIQTPCVSDSAKTFGRMRFYFDRSKNPPQCAFAQGFSPKVHPPERPPDKKSPRKCQFCCRVVGFSSSLSPSLPPSLLPQAFPRIKTGNGLPSGTRTGTRRLYRTGLLRSGKRGKSRSARVSRRVPSLDPLAYRRHGRAHRVRVHRLARRDHFRVRRAGSATKKRPGSSVGLSET